jgi:hypothetical protein
MKHHGESLNSDLTQSIAIINQMYKPTDAGAHERLMVQAGWTTYDPEGSGPKTYAQVVGKPVYKPTIQDQRAIWEAQMGSLHGSVTSAMQAPTLKPLIVAEPGGKIRVATIHHYDLTLLSRHLVGNLLSTLRRVKPFRAMLTGREPVITRVATDNKQMLCVSGDLAKGTDFIYHSVGQAVMRGILDTFHLDKPGIGAAALRLVGRMYDSEMKSWTRRGLHMGLGTSWSIMSILNLWATEPNPHKAKRAADIIIHGDDLAAYMKPQEYWRYQQRLSMTGMQVNTDKTFIPDARGKAGFVFCELHGKNSVKESLVQTIYQTKFTKRSSLRELTGQRASYTFESEVGTFGGKKLPASMFAAYNVTERAARQFRGHMKRLQGIYISKKTVFNQDEVRILQNRLTANEALNRMVVSQPIGRPDKADNDAVTFVKELELVKAKLAETLTLESPMVGSNPTITLVEAREMLAVHANRSFQHRFNRPLKRSPITATALKGYCKRVRVARTLDELNEFLQEYPMPFGSHGRLRHLTSWPNESLSLRIGSWISRHHLNERIPVALMLDLLESLKVPPLESINTVKPYHFSTIDGQPPVSSSGSFELSHKAPSTVDSGEVSRGAGITLPPRATK